VKLARWLLVAGIVGAVTQIAFFFFRLAYVAPLLWAAGLLVAITLTRAGWGNRKRLIIPIALTYIVTLVVTSWAFLDRHHSDSQAMSWAIKGSENQWKEPEVILTFAGHPGQFVGHFSTDLAEYLTRSGKNPVDVTFDLSYDFGCFRGFTPTRIGELTQWKSAWSYSGSDGTGTFPWPSAPWCF
jgi:hypothetical protein